MLMATLTACSTTGRNPAPAVSGVQDVVTTKATHVAVVDTTDDAKSRMASPVTPSVVMTNKPPQLARLPNENDQDYYKRLVAAYIDKKVEATVALELYKKIIPLFPAKDDTRQKILRYILDATWKMVQDRQAAPALALALELDKIIPNDFYIQNRLIGAYRVFAEDQIKAENLDKASEYVEKGLMLHFDPQIMGTKLNIKMLLAKKAIENKNIDQAQSLLNEVLIIIDSQDTEAGKMIFKSQKAEVEKILSTLK